jgi:hypothetical protein
MYPFLLSEYGNSHIYGVSEAASASVVRYKENKKYIFLLSKSENRASL